MPPRCSTVTWARRGRAGARGSRGSAGARGVGNRSGRAGRGRRAARRHGAGQRARGADGRHPGARRPARAAAARRRASWRSPRCPPCPAADAVPVAAPAATPFRTRIPGAADRRRTPTPRRGRRRPPPTPSRRPRARRPRRACVDLSANRSWLLRDGQVTYGPVPITHGRKGFRTPPGTFRVASKRRDHVSSIYDAEMPWSVFFNGGVAFHEGSLTVTLARLHPPVARRRGDLLLHAVGRRRRAGGPADARQRAMASAGSGRMPSRCARSTALTRSETPSFA